MPHTTFESDPAAIDAVMDEQTAAGTRTIIGSMINAAGLMLGKSVPLTRLSSFHRTGLGSAPVWNVFTIDGGIAFTDDISPVGDMRLRIDLAGLRSLGDGISWGPATLFTQDGTPLASCSRSTLARIEAELDADGYSALVGHELEFVLVNPDGEALNSPWAPYGVTGLLNQEVFVADLLDAFATAKVGVEQLHSEYGHNQFEFSLAPTTPVVAADTHCLAKVIVGRVARRHGLGVSFSPVPFPGAVGNGAHQHFSLTDVNGPIFAGGTGVRGLTSAGEAAIGGVVDGLVDIQGVLTGSVLSGTRLGPGSWSGAFACWGTENREAAVRFLTAGPANPHGANVEVKIVDPSANVYLASAAILALAHHGIRTRAALPSEVTDDPGRLTEGQRAAAGIAVLSPDAKTIIDRLDTSSLARELLGDANVDAVVACRRYEQSTFAHNNIDELARRFRLTWSA